MHRILAGFAIFTIAFLVLTSIMGWYVHTTGRLFSYHIILGLMTAIFTCLVHCAVLTHFIGTGKGIKEAVATGGLSQGYIAETRRFKARTSPLALFSMLFMMAAAILGGAVDTHVLPVWVHWTTVAIAAGLNLWTFPLEYRILKRNSLMMKEIEYQLASRPLVPGIGASEGDRGR